jgi:hypothetical protein
MPPVAKGWHRHTRHNPISAPRSHPCVRTASTKYSLHVGANLHEPISSGDIATWYPRTAAIRTNETPADAPRMTHRRT